MIDHKTFQKSLDDIPDVFKRIQRLAKKKIYGNAAASYLCDVVSFQNASEEFLLTMSACLKGVAYEDGSRIVVGGTVDTHGMFFITRGTVGIESTDGSGNDIAKLGRGEFFGEGMLLGGESRSH